MISFEKIPVRTATNEPDRRETLFSKTIREGCAPGFKKRASGSPGWRMIFIESGTSSFLGFASAQPQGQPLNALQMLNEENLNDLA
jgi:hypothetical protein